MRNKISNQILEEIKYIVWKGDLRNHFTYQYWYQKWSKIFFELNSNENMRSDDFLKQNKVTTLTYKNQIIAMQLLSEFQINQIQSHSYFSSFPNEFIDILSQHKIQTVQTLQYLFVDENWLASKTCINFGAIIGKLSIKNQELNSNYLSLTLARKDLASASLAKKGGFVEISESRKHNVPVGLLVCFEVKPYPQEEVNQWADYYWKNKETYVISDNENQIINFKPNKAA